MMSCRMASVEKMIMLVPVGGIDRGLMEEIKPPLEHIFGQTAGLGDKVAISAEGKRGDQHLASSLLASLPSPGLGRVLGITEVDLYAPGLNFVFGEAEPNGKRALISSARLRPEFYGSLGNEALLLQRLLKEAVHELGHTYGLRHCEAFDCVMHFSNSLQDTDRKHWRFCADCQRRLGQSLNSE